MDPPDWFRRFSNPGGPRMPAHQAESKTRPEAARSRANTRSASRSLSELPGTEANPNFQTRFSVEQECFVAFFSRSYSVQEIALGFAQQFGSTSSAESIRSLLLHIDTYSTVGRQALLDAARCYPWYRDGMIRADGPKTGETLELVSYDQPSY